MEMDEESLPVFWEIWIRRKSDSIFVRFENLSVLDTIWVSIKYSSLDFPKESFEI